MKSFALAARSHIYNVVLCAVAMLTLAACGDDSSATGAAAVATTVTAHTGRINRSPAVTAPAPATAAVGGTTSAVTTPAIVMPPIKPGTGVATLDWMPPTQNSDGSALTNLAGYTVYYGTSPTSLTKSVKVANPGLTAYTVIDLPPGTWYFAVTSYSSTGVESARTGTISTTI